MNIENDRHDAIMAQLVLLRDHALRGLPPRKRPRVSAENMDNGRQSSEALRQNQLVVRDQLADRMGIGFPSLKAVAGRLALRLLSRAINDMKDRGKGTTP